MTSIYVTNFQTSFTTCK